MAGTDQVYIDYLVNLNQFKAEFKEAEATLRRVEKTGIESAKTTQREFQKTSDSIKQGATQILGAIGVAFGTAQVISFGKESIKAFTEAEANANKLRFAVEKIGGEGASAFNKLIKQSEELQKTTIFSDDSIQQAQTQLTQFGLTSDQVEKLIPQIADLASATGTDLASATEKAIQGINGQTRGLKQVGISYADTGSKTQNLALLTEKLTKFQGASAEALETTAGKAKRLENAFDDIQEKIGEYLVGVGADILDNFEVVFGGGANDVALRKNIERSLSAMDEVNAKTLTKAKESESARLSAISQTSKNIIALFDARGKQENFLQQQNIDAQIKNQQKFREDLLSLNKEYKIKDDATLAGNADAKKAEEDRLKAKKDALDDLLKFDEKTNKSLLDSQAQTDFQKLELVRDEALKELEIKVEVAKQAGVDLNTIAQSQNQDILKITETFNNDKKVLDDKLWEEALASADQATQDEAKLVQDNLKKRLAEEERLVKESEARKKKLREQTEEALASSIDAFAQISRNNTEREITDIDKKTQKQIDSLDYQLEHKLISQETYDAKVAELEKAKEEKQRKLKKQQFETDRQIALVKAIISTAQAVITQFAETGYYGAILAGAVGAAQIAIIASEPTPQFEKGGKVKGKRHREGGTRIEAEVDEFIVNRNDAMKNDPLLNAINKGNADRFIFDYYIAPALKAQQKKQSESRDKSFASNLVSSMGFNFKDGNLLESLKQSRKNDREIAKFLASELKPKGYDARRF